jgi:hypothetical protein
VAEEDKHLSEIKILGVIDTTEQQWAVESIDNSEG